ncbi:MAG: hypothetical protein RJA44_1284 [Pseudomonadota bacterium]
MPDLVLPYDTSMSSTADLVLALKAELKASHITYAELGTALGMAESSIKRMFAKGDMPLSRIDAILRVLKIDFAELARRVADAQPAITMLTEAQEHVVVADARVLLVAICCLSCWSFEQILANYRLSEAEVVYALTRLDAVGVIELRPLNRYRLLVSKGFRWQPDGPVMRYFRSRVVGEYFSGGFDADGELLTLVHGSISPGEAALIADKLQRVAQDFAQQHLSDQRVPGAQRQPYTLVIGWRHWVFSAFSQFQR